jgi:hypothetical protein
MSTESIIDASKPNPGRMYDYYLGGSHNFEVDRQAGEQVLKLLPFSRKYVRLQRWALQDIAVEVSERRGYDVIIDFASGLPTNDHIHHTVPQGTTVIYSDYDPVVVEYAHEILGNTPNVYYFHADANQPEELLNRPEVQRIVGDRRKVAFVYWGISGFLPEEGLTHAARVLYDWADPGSCWAFNIQTGNPSDPAVMQVVEMYKSMGTMLYLRDPEGYKALLKPWRFDEPGFISLLEWHGFDQSELGQEDVQTFGPLGGGYGGYLIK